MIGLDYLIFSEEFTELTSSSTSCRNGFRVGDLEKENWKTKYYELSKEV